MIHAFFFNLCIFGYARSLLLCARLLSCGELRLLFVAVLRLLIAVASLVKHGLQAHGLQYLWYMGLVLPLHLESSSARDLTHVAYIGRWILIHQGSPFLIYSLAGYGILAAE